MFTGSPQSISVTVAGTLTFTVSGSVDRFQLEGGAFPTPFIASTGAQMTRAVDIVSFNGDGKAAVASINGSAVCEVITPTAPATQSDIMIGGNSGTFGYYFNSTDHAVSTLNSVANLATTANAIASNATTRVGLTCPFCNIPPS